MVLLNSQFWSPSNAGRIINEILRTQWLRGGRDHKAVDLRLHHIDTGLWRRGRMQKHVCKVTGIMLC